MNKRTDTIKSLFTAPNRSRCQLTTLQRLAAGLVRIGPLVERFVFRG